MLDELQQERRLRQDLEARVAHLEELVNANSSSNSSNLLGPISEAEVQEKFALLEELETVTLEKDEAIAQLGLERAKFSEDSVWLSSFDDEVCSFSSLLLICSIFVFIFLFLFCCILLEFILMVFAGSGSIRRGPSKDFRGDRTSQGDEDEW